MGTVSGRATIALDGVGDDGLFHAAQTLRQLIGGAPGRAKVPGVLVRDWPGTAVRGMTEGFYGEPWGHQERLAQLDFMGRTKQNRYLYAPGDDAFRQARWREPYPAAQRAEFRDLAERAARNHVTLAWAVAPAQAMCMSSDDDVKALNRKIDAMWALGVRAFQLQFQDVSYSEWRCEEDRDTFGSGPGAAAKAQARVANAVADHLARRHAGGEPLTLMPTEYFQEGATEYRTALAGDLDGRVQVAWTGVGVVPRTITGRELAGAREAFKHPLVTMDNYPVNDYERGRIFSAPTRAGSPPSPPVRPRSSPTRVSSRPRPVSRCSRPPTTPGIRAVIGRRSPGRRPWTISRTATLRRARPSGRSPGTNRRRSLTRPSRRICALC